MEVEEKLLGDKATRKGLALLAYELACFDVGVCECECALCRGDSVVSLASLVDLYSRADAGTRPVSPLSVARHGSAIEL